MKVSTKSTAPRSRRKTILNVVLALVGGALLVLTVQRVGWQEVQNNLASLGWWFVPVLVLGGLRFSARARAWRVCLESMSMDAPTPSTWALFKATLVGDALGNATPLGLLASEPAKVLFVKEQVSLVTAVSSVAAENAFYTASVLAMIGAGALAFFELTELSPTLRLAAQAVLGIALVGGCAAIWIARQQPAILSRLARLVASATGRGATAPDRLREVEMHFYAILRWPIARIAHVLLWEGVFHLAAVAEVFMVLRFLPSVRTVTLLDAFVLESTGRLIVVAFKFIPYRFGVDEAGTALVARALALDPAMGVTLAVVRRLRVLFWNGIGLVLLTRAGSAGSGR